MRKDKESELNYWRRYEETKHKINLLEVKNIPENIRHDFLSLVNKWSVEIAQK